MPEADDPAADTPRNEMTAEDGPPPDGGVGGVVCFFRGPGNGGTGRYDGDVGLYEGDVGLYDGEVGR